MNVLTIEKQSQILNLLVEGNSIRSIARIMCGDKNARVSTDFQLSSDSFQPYKHAVRRTFGNNVDYAQIP